MVLHPYSPNNLGSIPKPQFCVSFRWMSKIQLGHHPLQILDVALQNLQFDVGKAVNNWAKHPRQLRKYVSWVPELDCLQTVKSYQNGPKNRKCWNEEAYSTCDHGVRMSDLRANVLYATFNSLHTQSLYGASPVGLAASSCTLSTPPWPSWLWKVED